MLDSICQNIQHNYGGGWTILLFRCRWGTLFVCIYVCISVRRACWHCKCVWLASDNKVIQVSILLPQWCVIHSRASASALYTVGANLWPNGSIPFTDILSSRAPLPELIEKFRPQLCRKVSTTFDQLMLWPSRKDISVI